MAGFESRGSDDRRELFPGAALGFGNSGVNALTLVGVNAFADGVARLTGAFQTLIGKRQQVRKRGVGQRERGSVRDRRRHVADAVMEHVVDEINGISVGGGVRGFETTSLVDG